MKKYVRPFFNFALFTFFPMKQKEKENHAYTIFKNSVFYKKKINRTLLLF